MAKNSQEINIMHTFFLWVFACGSVACFGFLFTAPTKALAAPVSFVSSTTIALTSPAINLTVATGSVADLVTVDAGDIVVAMSASTGGNFVFTSPKAMTVSGSGATDTQTCSGGLETNTIAWTGGSASLTLTPTASACVSGSGPVISGISAGTPGQTTATVTWTTDVAADSQVEYGVSSSYTASTTLDSTLVTSHSIGLSGLTASILYHFRVLSSNGTSTASSDQTFTTAAPPSSGGGGGSGGGYYNPPATPPPATSTPSGGLTMQLTAPVSIKLINDQGTYYLILNGIRHGITNPGMLASYGFSLPDAVPATAADTALPKGSLLLPEDGALVKSREDPTVYLISNGRRYGFVSAKVFLGLGHTFASVLVVTNPELQALPKSPNLVQSPLQQHLPGTDVNKAGTVYWIGNDLKLHAYPSLEVYNSWHVKNNFSTVVPANSADFTLPMGDPVILRVVR